MVCALNLFWGAEWRNRFCKRLYKPLSSPINYYLSDRIILHLHICMQPRMHLTAQARFRTASQSSMRCEKEIAVRGNIYWSIFSFVRRQVCTTSTPIQAQDLEVWLVSTSRSTCELVLRVREATFRTSYTSPSHPVTSDQIHQCLFPAMEERPPLSHFTPLQCQTNLKQ